MMLLVDPRSATPPYEQLRVQVLAAVHSGDLAPGDKLPTVRKLAEELGLAANTVARAYRELERDEVIETRGRNGSFIAANGNAAQQQVQVAAALYAGTARQLGVAPEEALAFARAALGIRS
ncbi:DNA-binding transcriptional regulator YhcF (GntR family) [Cryobacterium sp. CAN_C3]|uniref:GntR family transcriptional regulator n=1 Tax=unclassified Cryobacterium TaxID=2649013 RepID=UPI001A251CF8|nr:DNA-binding transcriptional regulator YhcF (GntR family) [Cryobacterium sp. CAN_C3]